MRLLLLLPLLVDLSSGFCAVRAPRHAAAPLLAKKGRRRTVADEIEALQRRETGSEPEDEALESAAATASSGIDEGTRAKLKAEIASPFRRLRQFFYVAAGVAGGLGAAT